jgi:hypothetical protein
MATKDDEKTTDVDDTEETEEEEYEAPDRDTWTTTTAALTKANNEAKKWRLRAQGKDEKWSVPGWQKAKAEADEDEDEEQAKKPARRAPKVNEEAIRREAEEAALAKAKPGLVKAAAKDAFKSAGLLLPDKGDGAAALARAFRLLDMDAVDVDEDGDVTGIDDAVKAVKREYPELFAKKGARAVNAGAGSNSDGAGKPSESSAARIAAMLGVNG